MRLLASLAPGLARMASAATQGRGGSRRFTCSLVAGITGGATVLGIAAAQCESAPNAFSWGRHSGGNVPQPQPMDFKGKRVESLAFSHSHAAAVDSDGNVWIWRASAEGVQRPTLSLSGKRALKVACGKERTYVLTKSGSVLYWPNEEPQKIQTLSVPSGGIFGGCSATDICAFGSQLGLVTTSGEAFALGTGAKGQLGHGKVVPEEKELVKFRLPSGVSAKQIAMGSNHTVVLTTSGQLYACGQRQTFFGKHCPFKICPSTSRRKLQLSSICTLTFWPSRAGANNQLQLGQDVRSTVKSWQQNEENSVSLLSTVPLQVQLPAEVKDAKFVDVGAGEDFTAAIALTKNGGVSVITFGWGLYGQLGHKSIKNVCAPRVLTSLDGYAEWNEKLNKRVAISPMALACGEEHTLVLLDNGVVMSWGSGREFQLGNNSQAMQKVPTLVMPLTPYKVSKIFAGARTSAVTL